MQYNGQTNNEFRYRWNNYKDKNRKSVRGEDHKQAGFFTHLQTAGHSGFINDTKIRFIDKTDPTEPTRRADFWIDTVKTRYPQGLNMVRSPPPPLRVREGGKLEFGSFEF